MKRELFAAEMWLMQRLARGDDMKCNHPYTERGNACVQCFKELEADNQRLRDAIASYHDHHKQWEEYCYKCNPQG